MSLIHRVDGLHSIIVTDRDGVPLLKGMSNHKPYIIFSRASNLSIPFNCFINRVQRFLVKEKGRENGRKNCYKGIIPYCEPHGSDFYKCMSTQGWKFSDFSLISDFFTSTTLKIIFEIVSFKVRFI